MPKNILIIKNITREGPGLLEIVLSESNIAYTIIDLSQGESLPTSPKKFSAVVVLGGPDSANDHTAKMETERTFVQKVLDQHIPYLGICLGLQIMVKVTSGEVYASPVKEIGFRDPHSYPFEVIMLTQAGEHDPLFTNLGEQFRVFQLHGETVRLTPAMQQLAIGRLVKNQIVKIGSNAYGIQCHFELTPEMFAQWIQEDPDLLKLDRNILHLEFESIKTDYTAVGRQLFRNFLEIAEFKKWRSHSKRAPRNLITFFMAWSYYSCRRLMI